MTDPNTTHVCGLELTAIKCEVTNCNPTECWSWGYGLAGGGMGAYVYCDLCEKILHKEQDIDDTGEGS